MPTIESIHISPVTFRLKQPFVTAAGRKSETRNVQVKVVLSDGTRGELQKTAKAAVKKGFRRFKVKLAGDTPKQDAERIIAVHKAAPNATLVADGNQGLNASQATELIHLLTKVDIHLKFLEQ